MKVVFLNGPPRSGKDTVGHILENRMEDCGIFKMAQPIIDYMERTFGVSCLDNEDKDAPCALLQGQTRRQVAINYSELFMKPTFGNNVFGRIAADSVMESHDIEKNRIAVFTDSGFAQEAAPIADAVGFENCLQVKIRRPGHDFNGDSRSYWMHPHIEWIDFHNSCQSVGELYNVVASDLVPEIKKCLGL